ncbi:elongation factor G [Streptomyces sp. TP-A0874]|uniref:elongation factor G n=1 Tax=Streptomyces sp. TP-A0874 TaxID=549819 RepID=UPI0008534629|nr:TetM/TetW/TetO/TetS family tetracycline resistance ribosomal protection protein [Streptomyces sp. TP-A0874]
MRSVNTCILAHIDAGKTSLTERLLYDNGVLDTLGSVDAGTTRTDSNEIEQRRGITVRSAVASFDTRDRRVNLVDTPGHSEFIAEVERALRVLDGAVLVVSAVEGVQAQTRVIMKTLQELRLPTLVFVNKIDRGGARGDELLTEMRARLSPHLAPMNRAENLGSPAAVTRRREDPEALAAVLSEHDEALLADLVADRPPDSADLAARLAEQTARGLVHPVYFGSARTGQGVADLVEGIRTLLPPAPADADGPPRGTVFAVERAPGGAKIAYLRLFEGELRPRQRVSCFHNSADGTATGYSGQISGLRVVRAGDGAHETVDARAVAGDLVSVRGLSQVRVGDTLGAPDDSAGSHYFARPTLETLVRSAHPRDTIRLHAALVALAEQDPLISTRPAAGGQTSVLLYGEIQKEIIAETLSREFGVEAAFEPSRPLYLERPAGRGAAFIGITHTPFTAGVGLRVEPAPRGAGVLVEREVKYGALPAAFHSAIESTVRATLTQGLLGWPVTDCRVTVTHTEFDNATSCGGDFRNLTPLVLMRALSRAGTRIYEPCHVFEAEAPLDLLEAVTTRLLSLEARIRETTTRAGSWVVSGDLPARQVHTITRQLPDLTRGEGHWWSRARGDRSCRGAVPSRERTDRNPLDPGEYMFHFVGKLRTR